MFDYHVHSHYSSDCTIPIAASCEAAIAAGISEIAITDHVEHEPADPSFGFYCYEDYLAEIEAARERCGDRLTILAGAEVDFNWRIRDQVAAFLETHDAYDFVIGSVHYGDDGEIIFPEYFEPRTADDVFLPYFEQLQAAAETGWFDTLGHIDLPKRYAPLSHGTYDPRRYESAIRHVLRAVIASGMSFEINTSGMRQTPKASMPGPLVVHWYVDAGGTLITTGTDSHVPETIGAGLAETFDMLKLCGLTHVSSFRRRQRRAHPIESMRPAALSEETGRPDGLPQPR